MTLPSITPKQQEILRLIYRHRFLDRTQIQAFMHHNDKKRSISWLKDLRDKHYVEWIYSTDFAEKTKPAIYFLSLNGVRYLRSLELYSSDELRKRYKESTRRPDFIARCLVVADYCVTLDSQSSDDISYSYITEADYIDPEHAYHFLSEIKPSLCFIKKSADDTVKSYLLEVFDATTPRYMVKKRLKDYVEFLDDGAWEKEAKDDASQTPVVLIACPTTTELIYAKRRTRMLLEGVVDRDSIHIRFATIEKLRLHGVTGMIWEEA